MTHVMCVYLLTLSITKIQDTHDGNILQHDIEFLCSIQEIIPNPSRDDFSIRDKLRSWVSAPDLVSTWGDLPSN
jgi:hypothetical protein